MAVEYELFLPEVLPYLPDVAEPVALNAIRNAVIEFCDKTQIWQSGVEFQTVAGTAEYPISEPLDGVRASSMRIWCDGVLLTPYGKDTLTSMSRLDWRKVPGRPTKFTETNGTLVLVPVPDDVYQISGEISWKPTRDSDNCPFDPVYDVWLEFIAAGAIARLANMMGAPYFNPERAAHFGKIFEQGIGDGKIRSNVGFGRGQMKVQMRPFARGSYPWR